MFVETGLPLPVAMRKPAPKVSEIFASIPRRTRIRQRLRSLCVSGSAPASPGARSGSASWRYVRMSMLPGWKFSPW
jgi:hypothetical protein